MFLHERFECRISLRTSDPTCKVLFQHVQVEEIRNKINVVQYVARKYIIYNYYFNILQHCTIVIKFCVNNNDIVDKIYIPSSNLLSCGY